MYIKPTTIAITTIDHQKAFLGNTATVIGSLAISLTANTIKREQTPATKNTAVLNNFIMGINDIKSAAILKISANITG